LPQDPIREERERPSKDQAKYPSHLPLLRGKKVKGGGTRGALQGPISGKKNHLLGRKDERGNTKREPRKGLSKGRKNPPSRKGKGLFCQEGIRKTERENKNPNVAFFKTRKGKSVGIKGGREGTLQVGSNFGSEEESQGEKKACGKILLKGQAGNI